MANKFVGYFLEQVSEWQNKLSTADSVITIWFEVQVTWSHLESIFIGSEDIRAQLPEHSKRFDTINADFKVLMKEAEKTPNVVKFTNRKRLYEELEDIQKRLAVCEKALADYLETKRLAFPRFYFVSSSDLLDILSKGNQPVQVIILLAIQSHALTSIQNYLPHRLLSRLHVTWQSCLTAWLSSSSRKIVMSSQPRKLWACTVRMENMLTLMNLANVLDRY